MSKLILFVGIAAFIFGIGTMATEVVLGNDTIDVVINEVMYYPDTSDTSHFRNHEWVELFNKDTVAFNIDQWVISNRDASKDAVLPNWDFPESTYLVVHFTSGIDDSDFTDGEGNYYVGDKDVFADTMDECALYFDTLTDASTIINFVSWSSDTLGYVGGHAHDYAVAAGIWDWGDFFDAWQTENFSALDRVDPGESIGRDSSSTDTNQPEDWDFHGGKDAIGPTPGAVNFHLLLVQPPSVPPSGQTKAWTFVVYLDGDNNLEVPYFMVLNDMEKASKKNIWVVVLADFVNRVGRTGAWGNTFRIPLIQDFNPTVAYNAEHVGEKNMGSSSTLADFISWAKSNYPANKYALILKNHGGGWKGHSEDWTSGDDFMYMDEFRQGLSSDFDLILFDQCLMGMVEVAYQIRGKTDLMLASEEVTYVFDFSYEHIFSAVDANPGWSGQTLGKEIIDLFVGNTLWNPFYTISLVDCQNLQPLVDEVSEFAESLTVGVDDYDSLYQNHYISTDNVQIQIRKELVRTERFEDKNFIDLYDFAKRIEENDSIPDRYKTNTSDVRNALEGVIIKEEHGLGHSRVHGLSIYFPGCQTTHNCFELGNAYINSWPSPELYHENVDFDFPQNTQWDGEDGGFLHRYYEPAADAGEDTVLCVRERTRFDGSGSSDAENEIVAWHWDLGNGHSKDDRIILYTYEDTGHYEVILTVVDKDEKEDTDTLQAIVTLCDYGDAHNGPYPSYLTVNGARHKNPDTTFEWLGDLRFICQPDSPQVDKEEDTWQIDADSPYDPPGPDDGIRFLGLGALEVLLSTSGMDRLRYAGEPGLVEDSLLHFHGWIDFNCDGDWDDIGEHLLWLEAVPIAPDAGGTIIVNSQDFIVDPSEWSKTCEKYVLMYWIPPPTPGPPTPICCHRFRLNYGEPKVNNYKGPAYWGEVECYCSRSAIIIQPDTIRGMIEKPINYTISATDPDSNGLLDSASILVISQQTGETVDPATYSIDRIEGEYPDPYGTWKVHWNTAGCPEGGYEVWHDVTEDSIYATSYCMTKVILVDSVIESSIGVVDSAFPGKVVEVPVNLCSRLDIGGFKLYIEYDPTVLTKLSVKRGDLIDDFDGYYDECGHVPRYFFQYLEERQLPCEQQCETYKIKIVGIADMPDGWETGPLEAANGELINLTFQVAKDANLQDLFLPVKFEFDYDFDSLSNSFSSASGGSVYVDVNWPGQTGDRILQIVTFINGGVKVHSDAYWWTGDINMNEYPYEIADAVLFANYFLYGLEVFEFDPDIQILATDVNQDGFTLSMSDFVFLIRIILEDISPKHKLAPSTELVDVTLSTQGDAVKVVSSCNTHIGAGLYVFRHSGEVKNLITHTHMDVKYHDADGELRVLVYNFKGKSIPAGTCDLFSFEANDVELVQVEATDFYGSALKSTISTKVLPTEFLLMNNYPNPFNLSTSIGFALPEDCQVSLKLYNIAGQLVKAFEGAYEPGIHTVTWDGTNTKGEKVSSGIYFYKLVAGDFVCTKKMVMLK
jgi:hypothetical protein